MTLREFIQVSTNAVNVDVGLHPFVLTEESEMNVQ